MGQPDRTEYDVLIPPTKVVDEVTAEDFNEQNTSEEKEKE